MGFPDDGHEALDSVGLSGEPGLSTESGVHEHVHAIPESISQPFMRYVLSCAISPDYGKNGDVFRLYLYITMRAIRWLVLKHIHEDALIAAILAISWPENKEKKIGE